MRNVVSKALMAILLVLLSSVMCCYGAEKNIEKHLVKANGKKAAGVNFEKQKYVAYYFSAHWCPPCRAFTPKLAAFYSKYKKGNNFEVVFVSSDKNEKSMYKYMKEAKMPWPAIKFNMVGKLGIRKQYAGNGIPCLVLVDNKGKVVSDSFVNGNYVGPYKVMADLEKKLAE
ncbi:MAG: thioredoxin-like domain-containing protein [Planctomycetota bacterium]|jgi:nucleoredoxin